MRRHGALSQATTSRRDPDVKVIATSTAPAAAEVTPCRPRAVRRLQAARRSHLPKPQRRRCRRSAGAPEFGPSARRTPGGLAPCGCWRKWWLPRSTRRVHFSTYVQIKSCRCGRGRHRPVVGGLGTGYLPGQHRRHESCTRNSHPHPVIFLSFPGNGKVND